MAASASQVSRHLHRAGFRPVSPEAHNREGLKARNRADGTVLLIADLDRPAEAARLIQDATEALAEAGYVVEPHSQMQHAAIVRTAE